MRMMRGKGPYRAAFVAMSLALLVACSGESGPKAAADPAAAQAASLEAAMQVDRDFAAMAKKDGLKAAFLHYMDAKDGQFIQPGVVLTGADKIAAGFDGSPPDFMVDWTPDGGHGSVSGDMAVTTGLFQVTTGGQTIDKGRYVTVWRKDAAGQLKAVMDLGVSDPPAAPAPATPDKPDFEGRPG
jgi:ketosteroid isomerase-like protein